MKHEDEQILRMYDENNMSCCQIAEHFNTYPNKIRRRLKKLGIKIRNKSEAQSLAMKTGRSVSPTEGVGHTTETKLKLAYKSHEYWESLSEKEKEKIKRKKKKDWENRSKKDVINFTEKSVEGNLKAAKHGSSLEHFLFEKLTESNYYVLFHHRGLVAIELEVDLYLPELDIAIEVDGPSHFLPIWGEEKLAKTMQSDQKKNAQLVNAGIKIIRIKNTNKHTPLWKKNELAQKLIDTIEKVRYSKRKRNFVEITI